jgi:hypothetical protein
MHADDFFGRLVWAAILPMGIDEVLVARNDVRGADGIELLENLKFDFSFRWRLPPQSRRRHVFQCRAGFDATENSVFIGSLMFAFFDAAGQVFGDGVSNRADKSV